MIKDTQPRLPMYAFRATANRIMRHYYEKVSLPSRFVALGDAVRALCPVYDQGMRVSARISHQFRDRIHHNLLPEFVSGIFYG